MGSHATCSGAWCSGPEDVSPPEYFWGYNRMTTIEGLFGAGDAVGGTPHAFSSGSFTEGRLAAKAACKYIDDGKGEGIVVSEAQIERRGKEIFKPLEHYRIYRNAVVAGTVNPHYINPQQGLDRLRDTQLPQIPAQARQDARRYAGDSVAALKEQVFPWHGLG